MMNVVDLNCTQCGAPVKVSEDTETINCIYCGTSLVVQRDAGDVSLRLAKDVSRALQETQSTILESSQATLAELKRLQITQEINSLELQLSRVQSDIRDLVRVKQNKHTRRQLNDLRAQELNLRKRIADLRASLVSEQEDKSPKTISPTGTDAPLPRVGSWSLATILCIFFGWLGFHRFYSGHALIGFIQLVTFGGLAFWWWIDLFRLGRGTYVDRFGRRLAKYNPRFGSAVNAGLIAFIFSLFVINPAMNENASSGAPVIIALVVGTAWYLLYAVIKKHNSNSPTPNDSELAVSRETGE